MEPAVLDRFVDKIEIEPNGCWKWTACVDRDGYGQFVPKHGRVVRAHRFAYEWLVGPIPDGLQTDHLCRNTSCVNPSHLDVVTIRENVLRGEGITAREARQSHCVHGHEFTPENTRMCCGKRKCRICGRAWDRAYFRRKRVAA